MLKKLLRRPSRAAAPCPRLPDGERVYAVGDIHGRLDLLDELLVAIGADDRARGAAATTIIFLGDLVDRGPDSAGVVSRLRGLSGARFLLGNHEEVFLGALKGDPKALRLFCRIGGRETALSYGIDDTAYERADFDELAALLQQHVPEDDRAFLSGFEDLIVRGDYAFAHAGIDPGQPLDAQKGTDLRWIRNRFLEHEGRLEKVVVHGHTISDDVERRAHRIGIDTGAYNSGRLTALGLESGDSWELSTAG